MKRDEYNKTVTDLDQQRLELSGGKSEDYATEDVLSNFKRMNLMCKTLDIDVRRSPGDNARYLLLLKIDRWCNLVKKGTVPSNESIKDTVMDGLNYINLAWACDVDASRPVSETPHSIQFVGADEWLRDHRAEVDNDHFAGKPKSVEL